MMTVARLIDAAGYLFGSLARCVVFTLLDVGEWVAKWTR